MQIVTSSHSFGSTSGSGPQATTVNVDMGAPVTKAVAFLTGFKAEYSNDDDHNFGRLDVSVAVPSNGINGQTVSVNVTYGLRDDSLDYDDDYDGEVFFTVVGE